MFARIAALWKAVWGPAPPDNDGYGQSLADDLRSAGRFRRLAQEPMQWQSASDRPGDVMADFPILDRFGDGIVGWRQVGDENWFVIDRLWNGWPDPPEFAFVAFDADRRIVTGHDFHDWPSAWQKPPQP